MENNIFGPLTFKEFSYLAGGAGLAFLLYRFLPTYVAIFFIVPVIGFALALAFYRPNNKPFIEMIQSAIIFAFGSKLYIWRKERPLIVRGKQSESELEKPDNLGPMITLTHTGKSKLTDMSFNLGTTSSTEKKNDGLNLQI
jgi:hypothetical protein